MGRTSDPTRDASLAGGTGGRTAPEPPIFADGAMIGTRYRLIRLIARGGMGEVYEADDLELATRVAIKTIRAERAGDPSSAARLKHEILAARKVTHPNVIRLFDVGFHVLPDQREVAFFTMELLAGETLDARIRASGRLAVPEALALARQMAAALDALHAAGIVHRDFKPANVIVVGDRAIITDFGLARDHDAGGAAATTMMDFVGTPAYMAPEQVTRDCAIGPAADLYAFGVVLYEMVTGEVPFARDTALATAAARLEAEPPSPRARVKDLPIAWDAAIRRCLRRDPAARFARAGDVIAALTGRHVPWRPLAVAGGLAAATGGIYMIARVASGGGAAGGCAPPSLPDVFVDAAAQPGGTGGKACPLRTITAALAVAGDRRVIHVAAGFYDRTLGEQFPLIVRGATSIVGAGRDLTTISGIGGYDGHAAGGTLDSQPWQTAMVVGDAAQTVEVADLTLTSGLASTQRDVGGLLCTRGTADGEPNTRLRHVVIGPGFSTGIVAATETVPADTGCHLDVDDARLHDGVVGIWQLGCGMGDGRVKVRLRVHGSRFEAFRSTDPVFPGTGIHVWDCAGETLVEHSFFADSDAGMIFIRHQGEFADWAQIHDNELDGLGRAGIMTSLSVLAEIRDNRFTNITGLGDFLGRAAALKVYTDGAQGPSLTVRGNAFTGNDLGVELWGVAPIPSTMHLDLGRTDDPGGNTWFCNAAPAVSTVPGGDVAIRLAGAPGSRIDLAGNRWDHAPPTTATAATNGIDVLAPADSPLVIDTSGATFHGQPICVSRQR